MKPPAGVDLTSTSAEVYKRRRMRRTFPNKNLKPTYEVLFVGNDLDNHHIASRLLQGQMQKHLKLFPGIVDYDPDLSPVLILDKAKHQRGTGKALHDILDPIMKKYGLTSCKSNVVVPEKPHQGLFYGLALAILDVPKHKTAVNRVKIMINTIEK